MHTQIDERCSLPFEDSRFFKHAENEDDMPKVVASPTDPQEIALMLELISKAVYFSDTNLRTWKCADCKKNGVEIFLQDGTVTTVDEDGDTIYLVASENSQQDFIYDEMSDQYVLSLCHECFCDRGYDEE